MAIYYTDREGGPLRLLPVKCQHSKIVKQLYKNRVGLKLGREKYHSHIKVTGAVLPYRIHSVFFTNNRKVTRIWDSNYNGYRPIN